MSISSALLRPPKTLQDVTQQDTVIWAHEVNGATEKCNMGLRVKQKLQKSKWRQDVGQRCTGETA